MRGRGIATPGAVVRDSGPVRAGGVRPSPVSSYPQRHHAIARPAVPELRPRSPGLGRGACEPQRRRRLRAAVPAGSPIALGARNSAWTRREGTPAAGDGESLGEAGPRGTGPRPAGLSALASSLSAWAAVAAAASAAAPAAPREVRLRAVSAGLAAPAASHTAPPEPEGPGTREPEASPSPPPPRHLAPNAYLDSPTPAREPLRLRLRGSAPSPAPGAPHPRRVNLLPERRLEKFGSDVQMANAASEENPPPPPVSRGHTASRAWNARPGPRPLPFLGKAAGGVRCAANRQTESPPAWQGPRTGDIFKELGGLEPSYTLRFKATARAGAGDVGRPLLHFCILGRLAWLLVGACETPSARACRIGQEAACSSRD